MISQHYSTNKNVKVAQQAQFNNEKEMTAIVYILKGKNHIKLVYAGSH